MFKFNNPDKRAPEDSVADPYMTHGGDSIMMESSIGCEPGVTGLSSPFAAWSGLEDTECNLEKTI